MSIVKLTPQGVYSVIDIERMNAELTGHGIFQEYTLDKTDFPLVCENGGAVVVNHATKAIKKPKAVGDKVFVNATVVKTYVANAGRETYAVSSKDKTYLPRLFALEDTDTFSTNHVEYDDTEFATLANLKADIKSGLVFAIPQVGKTEWKLTKTTTGATVILTVADFVTLSNDRAGVRLVK